MKLLPENLEAPNTSRATGTALRAELAYNHLRLLLLEGHLGPGDRLSVVELTRELECSRVPIMEALKRLEGEGFVNIVPQVGCRVTTPRVADVGDFFILFANVESTISGFAAERRTAADLQEFAEVCRRVDAGAAKAGGADDNDPRYRRLNLMFHSCIHRMARSPVSTAIAAGLWDRSDFYIKLAFGSLYFSKKVKNAHQAIRKAIIAGDSDAARAATSAHLLAVGERIAAQLERGANGA